MMDLPLKIAEAMVALSLTEQIIVIQPSSREHQQAPHSELGQQTLKQGSLWGRLSLVASPGVVFSGPCWPQGPCGASSPLTCLSTQAVNSDRALCSQISPPRSLHKAPISSQISPHECQRDDTDYLQDDALKTAQLCRNSYYS